MALRHIHVSNRGEYGDFFLREGSQQRQDGTTTYWCQLTCNTSFGCVGHFWSSMGSPAASFLAKIDKGYTLGKLFGLKAEIFDAHQAVEDAKSFVRRDLESDDIDEATAAERLQELTDAGISNEFEWHIFVNDNDWLFVWLVDGARAGQIPNPQAEGFWEYLWPVFLDALTATAARDASAAAPAEVHNV